MNRELVDRLFELIEELDSDPSIRAIILTGAGPAFCAGVDLTDFAAVFETGVAGSRPGQETMLGILPPHHTPIIGAINGPAATGGLEVALSCDFLLCSENARFADTHARVAVMPSGGMTIRLPRLIGIDRARQMSLTGDYIDARTALSWGLVTEVHSAEALLPRARELAIAIASNDAVAVETLRNLYAENEMTPGEAAWWAEVRVHDDWMAHHFDYSALEARRTAIIEKGSSSH